ncbi:MAG: EamA family transporter, partial [Pseudomonadota bacterium]
MSTPIQSPSARDIGLLLLLAAIWASAFQAIKIAVLDVGPMWLVAARVTIGFLALLPWGLYRGLTFPNGARQWRLVSLLVVFNVLAPFFLLSWAGLTI